MIKFNAAEDNKQFVSISITDGTEAERVFNYISGIYPIIKDNLYKMDNEQILLNLEDNVHYGFSLNALRSTVLETAKANVCTLCVCM